MEQLGDTAEKESRELSSKGAQILVRFTVHLMGWNPFTKNTPPPYPRRSPGSAQFVPCSLARNARKDKHMRTTLVYVLVRLFRLPRT